MPTGRCHCGAVRYALAGEPKWSALCHCGDCRRHAGAPMVGFFYYNAVDLPGIADVQIATLDDPEAVAPMIQVQAAEVGLSASQSG
jgi:hypothetical protein